MAEDIIYNREQREVCFSVYICRNENTEKKFNIYSKCYGYDFGSPAISLYSS